MKRLLRWACLLSQMATAIPQALAYPSALKPQEKPSPLEGNRLDMLAQAVEKALNAWDVDTARLLMLQVEELNLHGLALLHYLQGRMAFQQGLYEEAVSEFVLAGQEDVPNSFLRLAKTGQRLLKNAQRFESAHFVLLLPQGKYAALAPYALEVLEAQYEALKADLGFAPREKLRVEMADNAPMLAGLLGLALEKGGAKGRVGGRVGGRAGEGAGGCAFGKMALLSPSALGGGFAWQNPLAYAYVCLAVAQLTRGQAPPWLQEALAAHLQNRWQRPPAASAAPLLYPLPYPPLTKAEGEALQKHMRASPRLLLEEYALGHSPSPLAFVEGFLLLEYWKAQQGPKAFAQLLEKLSLHGDVQRAIAELSGAPWAKWKQGFRRAVLARRFPKATPPPALAPHRPPPQLLYALRLAKLYAQHQRYEAAAYHYAKAWALGGQGRASLAQGYAQVLLALSRLEEAGRVLESGLGEATPAAVWLSLGKLHLFQSQWARAQQAFERALALNPFLPEVHLGLYAAAQAQNDAALAQRAQEAAAILLQTSPQAVVDMARAFSSPGG